MTMTPTLRSALTALALVATVTFPIAPAEAASETVGMSEAFKGFGSNGKDPIQIDADSLEVLDKDQNAVFTGNVHVLQKDTVLKTLRLKVFYEGKAAAALGGATAKPAAGTVKPAAGADQQQIRRLEAEGKVLINQKDQTVVGDRAWFDMASQTAQVLGHVVLTQGTNVGRGDRLSIDLKTGQYKLDGGRVQLILDSKQPGAQ
jgi:lipopolysaccharide export system protein LptA